MTPRISVIIPFRNRVEEVLAAAKSVLSQRVIGEEFELVLVNNNSTEDISRLRQLPRVKLIDCAKPGAAAARNAGIRACCGELVVFIDSDCIAGRNWLENLTRPLIEDEGLVGAGGRLAGRRLDCGVAFFTQVYKIIDQKKFFRGSVRFPPFLATANAVWRRSAIEAIGGFDESLWPCEDVDLSWRILARGGGLAYVPDAVVSHRHRETFDGLFRQALDYGSAAPKLFSKHGDKLRGIPRVDWMPWVVLGLQPVFAARQLILERRPVFRTWFVYESVWLAGLLIGRIRQAIRRGVLLI